MRPAAGTMRLSSGLVTIAACLYHHLGCTAAAPARTTDEVLLGEVDIAVRDVDSNEVTTKPFEKKCIVDGKSYSHAQAVSYDANSRCICVAGNVYCFWHGLPPTTESPADDRNDDEDEESSSTEATCGDSSLPTEIVDESPPPAPAGSGDLSDVYKSIDRERSEKIDDENDDAIKDDERAQDVGSDESTESIATTVRNNSPTTPITCIVLDRTYRVGEVLPHNTGNCVECSCGPEGHVVCAPRDCVSIVPHRDYREESFQIPVAGDLRGIDENF